jgi:hypothetical protein
MEHRILGILVANGHAAESFTIIMIIVLIFISFIRYLPRFANPFISGGEEG